MTAPVGAPLGEGEGLPTYGRLWRTSWPVMATMSSYMLFSAVDTVWIGRLGRSAVAGAAVGGAVMFLCFMLSRAVSTGAMSLMARRFGAGDDEGLRRTATETHLLSLGLGVAELIILSALVPGLVRALGLDAATADAAVTYTRIIVLAPPCWYMTEAGFAFFNGTGRTRIPFVCATIACTLNVVLDPVLMFGWWGFPAMGLAGAAWATVLSSLIESTIVLVLQGRYRGLGRPGRSLEPYREILSIGVPASARDLSVPLVDLCMVGILATFGDAAVAAYGVGGRVVGLMIIYVQGLAVGVSSLAGQELGRGRPAGARAVLRQAMTLGLGFHLLACLPLTASAGAVIRVFIDDPAVTAVGVPMLYAFAVAILFILWSSCLAAVFQAAGRTAVILASSLTASWLFQIPASLAAARAGQPLKVIWTIVILSRLIEFLVLAAAYRRLSPTETLTPAAAGALDSTG